MALTLLEAAKLNPGQIIQNAVIEEYARQSDILRELPFENINGNALTYNREDTLPGIGFRGVNEPYLESTGILNPQTESLVIAGGDLDVDKFIIDTMGANQRSAQEMMKVKALALKWTQTFIKGDSSSDPRVFDGLQKRITGSQLIANAPAGGPLSLTKLDELIDAVDNPTHLIVNKSMRRRVTAAGRNTSVGGFISYDSDAFGRKLTMYQDLPILIADHDNIGADILPFTEASPDSSTTTSCSIYCVSFGAGSVMGIQGSVGTGVGAAYGIRVTDIGELETKPVMRTRVEWYNGLGIFNGRGAARLSGITDAAVVA